MIVATLIYHGVPIPRRRRVLSCLHNLFFITKSQKNWYRNNVRITIVFQFWKRIVSIVHKDQYEDYANMLLIWWTKSKAFTWPFLYENWEESNWPMIYNKYLSTSAITIIFSKSIKRCPSDFQILKVLWGYISIITHIRYPLKSKKSNMCKYLLTYKLYVIISSW